MTPKQQICELVQQELANQGARPLDETQARVMAEVIQGVIAGMVEINHERPVQSIHRNWPPMLPELPRTPIPNSPLTDL